MMTAMSTEELPIILVSAGDEAAADKIISELIEAEMPCEGGEGDAGAGCVWQLSNKYYEARVRLRPRADGAAPPPAACAATAATAAPEAHVIYLAEHECTSAVLERRAAEAGAGAGAGAGCGQHEVQLALVAGAAPPGAGLRAAAARLGYELVELRAGAGEGETQAPFGARAGMARAREALHAHTWPGLRLRHPLAPLAAWSNGGGGADEGAGDSSSGGEGEAEGEEPSEAECVRRAELLADALAALGDAPRAEGAGAGGREARLLRAEQLVAAFCRALGADINQL